MNEEILNSQEEATPELSSQEEVNSEIAEETSAINTSGGEKVKEESGEAVERAIVFEEALEAILFAAGHPVSYATLARVFDMTPSKIKDKIFDYAIKYNGKSDLARGVILLTYSESCQLCTKELYLPEIRDALGIRKSGSLSTAAMETLAVVAYNQPVTRVFVDTIRKVDSSYAMNSLIDRGLIECVGRLDVPGRPMQYGTTADFLRCFGMKSIEELPAASEDLMNMFEKTNQELTVTRDEAQLTITDVDGEVVPEGKVTDTPDAPLAQEENTPELVPEEISAPLEESNDPSAEDDIIDID